MLGLGFGALWAGYAVASWGYILLKGYNITFRQWVSPLNPYTGPWPPAKVPPGFVLPHPESSVVTDATSAGFEASVTAPSNQSAAQLQSEVMPL